MLIKTLQKQSGLSMGQLYWIAKTASKRYKVYEIDKRNGEKRTIEHPSRELKAIQRWLNKFLFERFPIHENATAYKKGASIRQNAEQHLNSAFTLRLDFKNFFPSFTRKAIAEYLRRKNIDLQLNLTEGDIKFICDITTRNGHLAIGAPSSPLITNTMMYHFDNLVTEIATNNNLSYTRYADDLFISSHQSDALNGIETQLTEISRSYEYVHLVVNREKTAYLSRRYRRSITGLVITPDNKLSIGRSRKREIKSLIFSYLNKKASETDLPHLQGLLAFTLDVENSFFQSLKVKYGAEELENIMRPSED